MSSVEPALFEEIRDILRTTWNPVGIDPCLFPRSEYDSYIPPIVELLAAGASVSEIVAQLSEFEEQYFEDLEVTFAARTNTAKELMRTWNSRNQN